MFYIRVKLADCSMHTYIKAVHINDKTEVLRYLNYQW